MILPMSSSTNCFNIMLMGDCTRRRTIPQNKAITLCTQQPFIGQANFPLYQAECMIASLVLIHIRAAEKKHFTHKICRRSNPYFPRPPSWPALPRAPRLHWLSHRSLHPCHQPQLSIKAKVLRPPRRHCSVLTLCQADCS